MKKISAVILFLALAVWTGAENVSSVSFNPARLGDYEHLKVAGQTSLQGGLKVTTLNIGAEPLADDGSQAGGQVNLTYPTPGLFDLFSLGNVNGNAERTFISMPSATFVKNVDNAGCVAGTCSVSGLVIAPSSYAMGVTMNGGLMQMSGGPTSSASDSFINMLQANSNLVQYANRLNVNTLNITGNAGEGVQLLNANNWREDTSTKGFKLAGIDIPYPSRIQHCPADTNCVTTPSAVTTVKFQNFESTAACSLGWVERTLTPQTEQSPTLKVKVLALTRGTGCNLGCLTEDSTYTDWERVPCDNDPAHYKKRKYTVSETCVNGQMQTTYSYPNGEAWDISECHIGWTWISEYDNEYSNGHDVWNNNGYDIKVFGAVIAHIYGVDDTQCYYSSSQRLQIADSWDRNPNTVSSHTHPGSVSAKLLVVNAVNWNNIYKPMRPSAYQNSDVIVSAPPCSSTVNYGRTVEQKMFVLVGGSSSDRRCKGIWKIAKFKCQ